MRVLQIIDSLHPGGAERMAVQIANGLVGSIEFSALCCTREEGLLKEQLNKRATYLFANRSGRIGLSGLRRINEFINERKITHLHAHGTSCFTAFLLTITRPRLKLIWHDHYGNSEQLENRPIRLLKFISKKFNAIIVVNRQLQSWATQRQLSNKIFYLANFSSLNSSTTINDLNIPDTSDHRVVCLANLRPQKNHLMLLNVWRGLTKSHPEWSLLLVGKDFEDDYSATLKQFIKSNRLEESVFILGSRTDVSNILKQCQIGVLSSISEGLPLALLEYGTASLPVVTTDVGACREVVGNTGFVIEATQSEDFSNQLEKLITDPELRLDFGHKFYERVKANYGCEPYIEKLEGIYKSL